MAPIHLPPVGYYARQQQPSSNTGREEQRTRRKQCGHRWGRPSNSLTQARAPSQAQTSSHHTVATTESLPNSGFLPGPTSTPMAREGWMWRKEYPWGPHGVTRRVAWPLDSPQSFHLSDQIETSEGRCEGQPHPVCH